MRHRLRERGLHAEVVSAGVEAEPDQPAHPMSIAAAAEAGFGDLSSHRSRIVSPLVLRDSDFVLCMRESHRHAIVSRTPQYAGRIRLLGHWLGIEIEDPIGGEAEKFRDCLASISQCSEEWIDRLSRQGLLQ